MKIIAKTETGFLIEAEQKDLAALMGYTSYYDSDYGKTIKDWGNKIIGQEFDIVQATKTADYIRTLDTKVLADAQKEFESLARQMEETRNKILKLNLFEQLSADEF